MTTATSVAPIPIALCSDDYAQNEAIDDGILSLLAERRLSAVSCFSSAPRWLGRSAPAIREHVDNADIGMHFNLTEGFTETAHYSLRELIVRSYLSRLHRNWLRERLLAQLDAFEKGLGRAPAFIDGHQHVHQLPSVRQILLETLQERYADQPIWIRNTVPANSRWLGKPLILKILGGATIKRVLRANGVPTNQGFAGVYGFDRPDYDNCFASWLKAAVPGMLIMCHPAKAVGKDDQIAQQRVVEYSFLKSAAFFEMLDKSNVRLITLSKLQQSHQHL